MAPLMISNSPQQLHDEALPAVDSIHTPVGRKLRVTLVFEDNQWIAQEAFTAMFGEGDTQEAAMEDLFGSLTALFQELDANQDDLAPRLKGQLRELRALFG
jgi:hypothetical protein